jgi:hypothetical protein
MQADDLLRSRPAAIARVEEEDVPIEPLEELDTILRAPTHESVAMDATIAPSRSMEELPRWSDAGGAAGSHPAFGETPSTKGDFEESTPVDRQKLKGGPRAPSTRDDPADGGGATQQLFAVSAELPDAPLELDEPIGGHGFEQVLATLRARAEQATFPEREEVLYAIDLLQQHPYVRAQLEDIERQS